MKKILRIGVISLIGILILFVSYVHLSNPHVNRELRIRGFLMNSVFKFEEGESFNRMSKNSRIFTSKAGKDFKMEEITIKNRDGKDLRMIVLKGKDTKPGATGLLWLHGGGYGFGRPESDIGLIEEFIKKADTVAVMPDYTLSVEAPYPAALNDSYDALLWMKENSDELGINENQLFVGGLSAGGGLTAALSLYARDEKEVNIAFQMPIYPMINDKMDTLSGIDNDEFIWNTKNNEIAWKAYLGEYYGEDDVPKYAAPLRAEDFSNLPPTFTYVGELDPFCDDTICYVNELKEAGVETEFYQYVGAYHAFDAVAPNAEISQLSLERLLQAYSRAAEKHFMEQPKIKEQ